MSLPLGSRLARVLEAGASIVRGSTPRIDIGLHPAAIAVLEQVPVSETKQWVLIRSEDRSNPVVLFVHGGPGTSELTLMRNNSKALERFFTIVNWDQRRAGKSFAAGHDIGKMNIAQFVDDLVDLSSYLAKRFDQRKIVLVGHSWGTAIGMLAVARNPELFSAYVGIGQISRVAESELISYEWTLEQARKAADESSVKRLMAIGPPPYTGPNRRSKFMTERRILGKHGGEYHGSKNGAFGVVLKNLVLSTEYTAVDRINFFRGIFQSVNALFEELYLSGLDLFTQVPEVVVPVYFCLGRHDYEVPCVLSAKYFEALKAPRKELVWFENSAHMVNTEERDKFNRFMIETVLPGLASTA